MILAATGHRPQKLGGFGPERFAMLTAFARQKIQAANSQIVISGMALGWDQSVAQAALDLSIPLHAYVPFAGQESRWLAPDQKRFHNFCDRAEKVVVVCKGEYESWKMQRRNEAMVDACDALLALWDGSSGGTGNCVKYAKRSRPKPLNIIYCWKDWIEFVKNGDKNTSSMSLDWLN